jgi:hypothetical protein
MDENFSALTGSLGAGDGLTGGGFLPTGVEFNVGQGDGISVSADSIAVDSTVARTGSNVFTGPQNIQSALTASSALLGGFTYPTTDSSYGFVLATDGSGNLFFQQATSGSITSSGAVFPFTGSAGILGSLNVDGTITATTSVTVNDYTFPLADGTSGSLLTTDGSGTLSFGTVDSLITFDNVEISIKAGEALTKGDPVYISGTVGASERAIVSKADASDSSKMPAIGLAQEDMSINDLGKVTLSGFLRNITTDPIDGITPSSNDTVYVKAGGGLTLTKPSGSNLIQNIAKVGKVSGGNAGTLIVSAILRTNDVPNLLNGEVFYGVGDKAVQKPLSDILSGSEFTYSGSFSGSFVGPSVNVTSGSFTRLNATTGNVGTLTGTTSTFTSASLSRLDVTGNSTLDGDLTVTGRVTAEEFHTEFVSASIIYQSGSTKFGDTSDDKHSFTGSVEILGSLTGSSNIDIAGTVDANVYSINGTTVIDSSRNITGSNGLFTGDVDVANLDSTGNVDANTFSIDGSTVIDASENITGASLDVTGEVQGNSVSIDGFTVIDSSVNITGSSLDVSGNVDGNSYSVNSTSIITSGRVINNITQANVDNLRLDGNTLSNTATDQNVTIEATGTGILDVNVGSNFQDLVTVQGDIYPETNYLSNIGAINKKFLTLSVAELIVETLVASERRTTVGGRFNVGIGTQLSQSLSSGDTTIIVENNNLNPNDIIHLEGGVLPKVEFMKVTSTASSGSGDGFSYTVIRDLDGSGANDWDAGSGVFNTGAPGNGFIDQYAINSLRSGSGISTAGPTIAFMERTGSAYQDIDIRAGVGNLKGWYGYSSEIFGFAAGDYRGQNITVDPENGLRIRDINTLQFQASGSTLTIGDNFIFNSGTGLLQVSGSNVQLETPTFFLGNSSQFISGSNGNLRVESTNFTIAQNGDVTMTGTITAEAGQIGGFAITDSAITGSGFFLSGSATGNEFFISSSKFNVKANGDVTASNATIVGDITATNITAINQGNIAGFTLTSNQLSDSGNNLVLKSNGQITGSNVLFTGGKISGSAIAFDVTNFVAKGDTVEISGSNFHLLNGNITASNVDLSGNINAQTGTIGGFDITADALSSNNFFLSGSATGNEFFISASSFNVRANGDVTASNADISGRIVAESGTIGGFNIGDNLSNSAGSTLVLKGSTGEITASAADIQGKITAQSGTIGGFNITSNLSNSGGSTLILKGATGQITASAAQITGDITAQSGELQTLDVTGTLTLGASGNLISFDSNDYINITNEVVDVRGRVTGGTQTIYLQSKLDGGILDLNAAVETGTTDNIDGASFGPRGFVVASQTNNDLNAPRDKNGALFGAGSNIIRANNVDNSIDFFYLTTQLGSFDSSGDFYVDTDTLYVDASADRVGINDSTPSYALDVNGDIRTTGILRVDDYARIDALRVGTTSTDPGDGNLYVEGSATIAGGLTVTGNNTLFNSTDGDFSVMQKVSAWTNSTAHPIIRWDYNTTYSDNLALFSGGNSTLTSQAMLMVSETLGLAVGTANPGTTDFGDNLFNTIGFTVSKAGAVSGSSFDSSGNTTIRGNLTVLGDTTISGDVSGHPDITQGSNISINGSNGTVIQDLTITLDENGHVTTSTAGTVNLDGRYYTETESDNRFVNVSGDSMTGTLAINGTLLKGGADVSADTSVETVESVATATYDAAFFDFVIKNGSNLRAGTVYAVHDGTNVEFTETSTQDLGDTSDVTLSVDISGGNLRLRATTVSNGWTIKAFVRGL